MDYSLLTLWRYTRARKMNSQKSFNKKSTCFMMLYKTGYMTANDFLIISLLTMFKLDKKLKNKK